LRDSQNSPDHSIDENTAPLALAASTIPKKSKQDPDVKAARSSARARTAERRSGQSAAKAKAAEKEAAPKAAAKFAQPDPAQSRKPPAAAAPQRARRQSRVPA
jgi:hypothetical protein